MTPAVVSLGSILRLLVLTLRAPAEAAEALMALNLARAVLWQALALVTVLGVIVIALGSNVVPETAPVAGQDRLELTPLTTAAVLGSLLVILVFALHFTGTALGGTGTFPAALTLVVWLEVLTTAVRIIMTAVYLIAPALGAFVSLAGAGVVLWTLVNFVNALHGFRSLGKAAMVLILAVVGMFLGLAFILATISSALGGGGAYV
jgi:hypothetical protein